MAQKRRLREPQRMDRDLVCAATGLVILPITALAGFRDGTNRAQPRSSARAENEAENGRHRSVWQPIAVTSPVNAPQRRHAQYCGHNSRWRAAMNCAGKCVSRK